ncbi:MAG: hypothetical protein KGL59_11755 [Acidobacteriota bacterium]|nr:hypothetical protein [Acidobacteriota bacterium]
MYHYAGDGWDGPAGGLPPLEKPIKPLSRTKNVGKTPALQDRCFADARVSGIETAACFQRVAKAGKLQAGASNWPSLWLE